MKSSHVITALIAIFMPFVITMFSVRILLTPAFLSLEYRTPGFPDDPHGFSKKDRITRGRPIMTYLTNQSSSLNTLEFIPGLPVFNNRELVHLQDVKNIIQSLLQMWYISVAILSLLALLSWQMNLLQIFLRGIAYGGWLTAGIILFIAFCSLIIFDQLFSLFHELLFTKDSWLFHETDTLIRLFPLRFWQDCVLYVASLSFLTGMLCTRAHRKP